MDWNTLLSVALGGLIATIGSILSNRFQAQERQKDREEQRREAKIQAREKWIERDILKIMDAVEKLLILYSKVSELEIRFKFLVREKEKEIITNNTGGV